MIKGSLELVREFKNINKYYIHSRKGFMSTNILKKIFRQNSLHLQKTVLIMHKMILIFMFFCCSFTLTAQMSEQYVPCNNMPNIIQNYYADVTALNRVYIVDGSPEKENVLRNWQRIISIN